MVAGLLEEEGDSSFFQSGPGFGGATWPKRAFAQNRMNPRYNQLENRQGGSRTGRSGNPPARQSIRNVFPEMYDFKMACEFVKSRGVTTLNSLPDTEQMMANFSKHVFKVFSTKPNEVLVRLIDPELDTDSVHFTGRELRDPVEKDCESWMKIPSSGVKQGRHFYRPIVFIPPRGFLIVGPEEPSEESKVEKLKNVLTPLMQLRQNRKPIIKDKLTPGTPAVFEFQVNGVYDYFRVIIIGAPHIDGDVLALLTDVGTQHYVDAKLEDLYEIPAHASFNVYPPHVVYANIFGIRALSEEEQGIMWKNVDNDEAKKDICMFIIAEAGKVPLVDMIWRDEHGQLEWLSKILQRRGAHLEFELTKGHLTRTAASALPPGTDIEEHVMQFVAPNAPFGGNGKSLSSASLMRSITPPLQSSATPSPIIEVTTRMKQSNYRTPRAISPIPYSPRESYLASEMESPRAGPRVFESSLQRNGAPIQVAQISHPPPAPSSFAPSALDLYAVFDEAIRARNFSAIFGIHQFARGVLPTICLPNDVEQLLGYMAHEAKQRLGMDI